MVSSQDGDAFAVVDTVVLSYLTKRSPYADAYRPMLGTRRIVLSFAAETELLDYEWGDTRRERLNALIAGCLRITEVDPALQTWYQMAADKRRTLGLKGQVSDNDLWIVATAGAYGCPLITHDRGAVRIAESLAINVMTALPPED